MGTKHLNFLLLMVVIVIIKVKVIIRKREGNGPVRSRAGPPQVNAAFVLGRRITECRRPHG